MITNMEDRCRAPKEVIEEIRAAGLQPGQVLRHGENTFCQGCSHLRGENPNRLALENMLNRVGAKRRGRL